MPYNYLFIDECGDSEFYGKRKKLVVNDPGFQPLLVLGLVETADRRALAQAVLGFQQRILGDSLYNNIYSVKKPGWFLHARNDHPEIRGEFFKLLRTYEGIRFHAVIARKELRIFNRKHNNNSSEFYFDLVHHLLKGRLKAELEQRIYLAHKPKTTLSRLSDAIDKAIQVDYRHEKNAQPIIYQCEIQQSRQLPELSVVDYLLWALQRYLIKGELRFWETIEHQVGSVIDLYDRQNLYNGQSNQLRLEKMKPFAWLKGQ